MGRQLKIPRPNGVIPSGRGGLKFGQGQKGNPGGRPKIPQEVLDMARAASPEAIRALVSIVKSPKSNPGARVAAAQVILDRAWGKPVQQIEANINVWDSLSEVTQGVVLEALEIIEHGETAALEGPSPTSH